MSTSHNPERMKDQAVRLAQILTTLQRCFLSNLSKELDRGNVSIPQYILLGFLTQSARPTMGEVSQKMGHTMAASTGLVDRLVKMGLVSRANDADDRRRICVSITPKGNSVVEQVRSDVVTSLMRLMEHLTPDEVESWVHIYEKIFPLCLQKEHCK
jgi:DNA-binding MarR family transcriptional regulator